MKVRAARWFDLNSTRTVWLLASLMAAFGLRAFQLGAQSLWNDEGTSVALAPLSLDAIITSASRDIHPPLYYILLHFWMPMAGQTEFAVRFLSLLAGVLLVAVTCRIARQFFGRGVALLAAALSALSPFQVYYSQETRMYIWVALFAGLSVWAMVEILRRPQHGFYIGLAYVLATVAMLYTQYVGAFIVIAENLVFVIWLVSRWRARAGGLVGATPGGRRVQGAHIGAPLRPTFVLWVGAQAISGLAFLPWYLLAGNQLVTWPAISEPFDLPTLVWRLLNVFSVGLTLDGPLAAWVAIAFGIMVLLGMLFARTRQRNFGILVLLAWLLVPAGIMYLVSLSRPAYNPKFLLIATPPFYILAARGLSLLQPQLLLERYPDRVWIPLYALLGVAAIPVVFGVIPSLRNNYYDPRYARDDYRGILQTINAAERPGDGILVDDRGQIGVVRYYDKSNQPLYLLPRMRPAEPVETRVDVDEMLANSRRIFAIYYATEQGDPQGIVETQLADKAFKAQDEWQGNVRLAVYGVAPAVRPAAQPLGVRMGHDIMLESYRLDTTAAQAGDVLTLTLAWRAEQTPGERDKVFVHLLDAQDRVVAQRDGEPVADRRITTTWRAGELVADNYGIWIDPDTPPGEYRLEIGMYRAADGTRLPISDQDGKSLGDHLILGTVRVQ